MGNLGLGEIVVLGILAFVLLGPDRLMALIRDLQAALGKFFSGNEERNKDDPEEKKE